MIKSITIEAVSIKTNKKDGSPYMWNDKKTNTMKPRTMVSIKYKDATTGPEGEWLMGWSYKAGSAAEALAAGQTIDIKYEESSKANPDGSVSVFKSWRFPKQEDKDADEIAKLKAQLASLKPVAVAQPVPMPTTPVVPAATNAIQTPTPSSDGSVLVESVPF